MGTIKQNQDLETTWMIDTSNDTYILGKNALIETSGEFAIDVAAGFNNNTLILKGEATATDTTSVVRVAGNNTHVDVLLGGHINGLGANIGLNATGSGFSLNNAGGISGASYAVSVGDYSEVVNSGLMLSGQVGLGAGEGLDLTNSGRITGDTYGVLADADGAVIENLKGGKITADTTGVNLSGEGTAVIHNSGLIKAGVAISDGAADTTVINKGTIDGNVFLGAGDDVFNTRKGTFDGQVNGGDGNDTYIIGDTFTDIVEQPGFGYDKVKSTVSFTLGENLEDLILQGKKNASATGNEGNNTITGNKGDNVLTGMDGDDYLKGGKGDDRLFGGADQDMFDFRKGGGDDVVEDFVNGEDLIFTPFANDGPSIQDLIDNHAIAKNGGVLISYGDDSIFIKNMSLNQLDDSDFFQGL
ncbi:MAG: hemolysin-type calcium-binding repeat family protein [Rhizobium sp.]|nr:hemolysin-type calcium-binding repeat family protein [Rhizobium sp.]